MTVLRRAGARWRILVHEYTGRQKDGTCYGTAYEVTSNPRAPQEHEDLAARMDELAPDQPPFPRMQSTVLEGTEFDELVIGSWIHLEQMDTGCWWMNVGGVTVNVQADRDGRPKAVDVAGPDDYDGRVPGCRYSVTWSGPENVA